MNNQSIKEIKQRINPILEKHEIERASIFGSYAKGISKKDSDIDILIKFKRQKSLFDLVRLKFKLEKKLNIKVDLLTYQSLHPLLKQKVLDEQVKIL